MVVILALMMGLVGALFIAAMSYGMVDKWVISSIEQNISDLQINDKDYLVMEDLTMTVKTDEISAYLDQQANIESYTSRLLCDAMAMTANNSRQVKLIGINPEDEKNVTTIHSLLEEGDYFESTSRTKPIVVSQKLCEKLKVKLKSKIVFSLADANGEIQYENFRIVGIYKTSNAMFDEMNVFIRKEQMHKIISIPEGESHVVAARIHNDELLDQTVANISSGTKETQVRGWRTIDPALNLALTSMNMYSYILVIIVLVALVFGIINTMLMVILERTKEIGMLRALGMSNRKIGWMIMLETVMLCLVGVAFGNTISYALIQWFGQRGISLERYAEGFEAYGFSHMLYPALDNVFFLNITFMVILTAIFSSIFPIIRAFKLNPATAIRD